MENHPDGVKLRQEEGRVLKGNLSGVCRKAPPVSGSRTECAQCLSDNYVFVCRNSGEGSFTQLSAERTAECRDQLANGIPEDEVYTQWGMHCEERSCRRLGFLLSVNLRKGNRQLLSCLEEEIRDTRQELQKKIRKKGEEASTKLLFPMILYLIIVMILVIYPAYQKLGGV